MAPVFYTLPQFEPKQSSKDKTGDINENVHQEDAHISQTTAAHKNVSGRRYHL